MSFLLVGPDRMPGSCAATPPLWWESHRHAQLPFCCPGGGVEDGLEMKDTGLGSFESKVSLEEMSQCTRLSSSSV